MFRYVLTFGLLLFIVLGGSATIRYVKPAATGTGDGLSWNNAIFKAKIEGCEYIIGE